MSTARRQERLSAVLTLAAEANTQLAGNLCGEINESIETEDDVRDWLWALDEAESIGTIDVDQRAFVADSIFDLMAWLALDPKRMTLSLGLRDLAGRLASEMRISRVNSPGATPKTDTAWAIRVDSAKAALLERFGEREAARLLRSDRNAYRALVLSGRAKLTDVHDGRRSTYDDRPIPGTPAGRAARKNVRLSLAARDAFNALARDVMQYSAYLCGWRDARELALDICVGALAASSDAATAADTVRAVRPVVRQAVRAALMHHWQRRAETTQDSDLFRLFRQPAILDDACDAMERLQRRLAGRSTPQPPLQRKGGPVMLDRDILHITEQLLVWNPVDHGEVDRRLLDEPIFFERVWPLVDMTLRGLFAYDVLGERRPARFPAPPDDIEKRVREFLADRRPMPCPVSDAELESMWDEVSAG